MQQMEQASGLGGAERKRVEAVVETLANLRGEGGNLAEVAHDTRNMVTALGLYCDLLEEPGVLAAPYLHYGSELRLVAAASRRLVERLVALDSSQELATTASSGAPAEAGSVSAKTGNAKKAPNRSRVEEARGWELLPALPIDNLAAELAANRNLLAALAGPSIALTVLAEGGERPVWLTGEDLTRVLVNLVKNAAEAMPAGGRIALALRESCAPGKTGARLLLAIEDSGPGIPRDALEKIFESGYTTRAYAVPPSGWAGSHRGLGLAITRSIVEGAGGRIHAASRAGAGARFEIEMPVRNR